MPDFGVKLQGQTKQIFVTPWQYIKAFEENLAGVTSKIFTIPRPGKRFRISIGAVMGFAVALTPNVGGLEIILYDNRRDTNFTPNSENFIAGWANSTGVDNTVANIASVSESFYPDGLLLDRDVSPAINFAPFGVSYRIRATVFYRYEDWS